LLSQANYARGIYTSGFGDVTVIAQGTIDLEGSRIAAYNGGNVFVESLGGNVNAGSGASSQVLIPDVVVDPATHDVTVKYQPIVGSGILATTLPDAPISESVGDLTVLTPRGDIIASRGGIVQDPLNGNHSLDPTLTLTAGTRDDTGKVVYAGNIDANDSGVIGVNANLNAAGNITGLVVARGNSDINAAANVSGTFFSAGTANLNAGGTVSGTVIGVGGISANAGKIDASMLSQNVSVNGGKADSGLSSAATATTTSQSAVQNAEEETTKQVASVQTDTDDDQKKHRGKGPLLKKSVGRVTVILPGS
jgi:hypothetical protein